MFNEQSTAAERQGVLRGLLQRGQAATDFAPHSLPELNALLARTPEELATFEVTRSPEGHESTCHRKTTTVCYQRGQACKHHTIVARAHCPTPCRRRTIQRSWLPSEVSWSQCHTSC